VGACNAFQDDSPDSSVGDAGVEGTAPGEGGLLAPLTCVADLTSDPKHCGYCGHDCQGTDCKGGECVPTKLAAITGERILGFSINATNVFWYSVGNTVEKVSTCPKTGCETPTVLFTTSNVTSIASDDTELYATIGAPTNSLVSCAVTGCANTPIAIAENLGFMTSALVIDDASVFWVEQSGGVFRCGKSGACTPTAVSGPRGLGGSLNEYARQLYWIEREASIVTCDPMSCTPHTIVDGIINSLGVSPDGLFWADGQDNGTVTNLPLAGGQPMPFATAEYRPSGVVVDDLGVYWFTSAGASSVIKRAPTKGGPAAVIASQQDSPVQLELDDHYIYWADPSALWRVAK
jgi:hypothetical protein